MDSQPATYSLIYHNTFLLTPILLPLITLIKSHTRKNLNNFIFDIEIQI